MCPARFVDYDVRFALGSSPKDACSSMRHCVCLRACAFLRIYVCVCVCVYVCVCVRVRVLSYAMQSIHLLLRQDEALDGLLQMSPAEVLYRSQRGSAPEMTKSSQKLSMEVRQRGPCINRGKGIFLLRLRVLGVK